VQQERVQQERVQQERVHRPMKLARLALLVLQGQMLGL
jgi:hypothetical protein